jgi:dCMP deaminase
MLKTPARLEAFMEEAFMEEAFMLADSGTCLRGKVGCVIVGKFSNIIGYGYNSAPLNICTCEENGCVLSETKYADGRVEIHCETVIHAEVNAILNAVANGNIIEPSDVIFVTHSPCPNCLKLIVQLGITTIYYRHAYRLENISNLLETYKVNLICVP